MKLCRRIILTKLICHYIAVWPIRRWKKIAGFGWRDRARPAEGNLEWVISAIVGYGGTARIIQAGACHAGVAGNDRTSNESYIIEVKTNIVPSIHMRKLYRMPGAIRKLIDV